ncbi:MAG TPA: hypothetical protein EYP68_02900 [Candidatus Korarchaeota archaeon]|nr:hypothetical protein [Candidatus Korarchaeota archaeon]
MSCRKLASLLVLCILLVATGFLVEINAQDSFNVIGYATCKDVQNEEPWDPINVTEVFSTIDDQVVAWIRFGNVVSQLYLRYEFIEPGGTLFAIGEDMIEDPKTKGYDYYESFTHSVSLELTSSKELGDPRDYPGEWRVDLYVNDEFLLSFRFTLLEFGVTDYTMCESMQNSSPWNPINKKNVFREEDLYATAWLELSNVTKGLNVEFRWIDPDGVVVYIDNLRVPDPRTYNVDYFSSFRLGQQFTLGETDYYSDPREKPGNWKVEIYIEGKKELEMVFVIEETQKCLIATAAYGSELAPEVQALREFRDRVVLDTFAGNQFMRVFNAIYYSFSPYIANFESRHEIPKAAIRKAIGPLIKVLGITSDVYRFFDFNSEVRIVLCGMLASSLIGLIYITPFLALISKVFYRNRFTYKRTYLVLCTWLTAGLSMILAGEITLNSFLLMVGTPTLVLTTMALSSLMLLNLISHLARCRDETNMLKAPRDSIS